jgi:hypothetical protein
MKPIHAAMISLVLALAVGAGAFAVQRTTAAASSPSASAGAKDLEVQIASRMRALDRMEASLRKALRRRPPALPKMPKFKPVHVAPATSPPPAASAQVSRTAAPAAPPAEPRVITVRPPPRIVTVHRKGAEHEDAGHEDDHGEHAQQEPGADD